MVTIEEKTTIGGIINELKQNAERTSIKKTELSSLLSSLSRIYKETTTPPELWQEAYFSEQDFVNRIEMFTKKLQEKFSGKSTLSVYKARARKAIKLYYSSCGTTRPHAFQTPQDTASGSALSASAQAESVVDRLNEMIRKRHDELALYRFSLSDKKDAFLLVPASQTSDYLERVKDGIEVAIQAINNTIK
ncbi:hypothetical protein IJI72_00270 [Candidatus Saccharibacteria bacterium]|nr:hypothetical protein [Candidatus Saccharibacteria bacterium]